MQSSNPTALALTLLAGMALAPPAMAANAANGETIKVTGEVIDTWCYFSGVMGGPDAVVGSAHHTCAMWCAAGGIPVGILAEDGTVYMVLKWEGQPEVADGTAMLSVQSHLIEAEGTYYERDGIHYIMVSEVVADQGITTVNHDDFGVIPGFAIPDPNKQ